MDALRKISLLLLLAVVTVTGAAGCLAEAENIDWATRLSTTPSDGGGDEVQSILDTYARSLVDKNRDDFLSVIDPESPDFLHQQEQLYANLEAVPLQEYVIEVLSKTETGPDTAIVKVASAYSLKDSFSALPDPDRSAFYLVRRENGWKLSGDASEEALGKPADASLESFGQVTVTEGVHVIVLSHPSQASIAAEVRDMADAAYPRLQETLPGLDLPKVPVRVFDDMEQIDKAYPGGWQEWTGGASRQLGSSDDQGGEIIVDAVTYRETSSYSPDYNRTMLAHELTHVALFRESGYRTPPFLVEGLADYVAGIEPVILLRDKLRSGEPFSPTLSDLYQPSGFSTLLTTEAATLAYEESDTAVEYLEKTYGNEAVLELLRQFKSRSGESIDQGQLVDEVFRSALGVGWTDFESAWRAYVIQG